MAIVPRMEAVAKVQQHYPMHTCIPTTQKTHPQHPEFEDNSRLQNLLHSLFDSYQVGNNTSCPTQAQLRLQTSVPADKSSSTPHKERQACACSDCCMQYIVLIMQQRTEC
jgi:hypothetical protein